jgi:xanthine dehydrogenase molybdopterin-binding subunit B
MKPVLKAPGTRRLKPKHDKLLSNVSFKCNLRRYIMDRALFHSDGAYKIPNIRLFGGARAPQLQSAPTPVLKVGSARQ